MQAKIQRQNKHVRRPNKSKPLRCVLFTWFWVFSQKYKQACLFYSTIITFQKVVTLYYINRKTTINTLLMNKVIIWTKVKIQLFRTTRHFIHFFQTNEADFLLFCCSGVLSSIFSEDSLLYALLHIDSHMTVSFTIISFVAWWPRDNVWPKGSLNTGKKTRFVSKFTFHCPAYPKKDEDLKLAFCADCPFLTKIR